jgi:hypothetical protein
VGVEGELYLSLLPSGKEGLILPAPFWCGGLNSLPSPSMREGQGGGEVHTMPLHPNLPPPRGEGENNLSASHAKPSAKYYGLYPPPEGKGVHPSGIGIVALPGKVQPSRSTFG